MFKVCCVMAKAKFLELSVMPDNFGLVFTLCVEEFDYQIFDIHKNSKTIYLLHKIKRVESTGSMCSQ